MTTNKPEISLAKLAGEIQALHIAVQILAKTHPNPGDAYAEFELAELEGLATLSHSPGVTEAFLDAAKAIRLALRENPSY